MYICEILAGLYPASTTNFMTRIEIKPLLCGDINTLFRNPKDGISTSSLINAHRREED